jgi:hypothetical protein
MCKYSSCVNCVFKCIQVYVFNIWSPNDRFENETTGFETEVIWEKLLWIDDG